jgi:hypothetical protein
MGQIHCKKGNQYRTRDWVPQAFKSAYLESRDLNSCNLQSTKCAHKEGTIGCGMLGFTLYSSEGYIHT